MRENRLELSFAPPAQVILRNLPNMCHVVDPAKRGYVLRLFFSEGFLGALL